MTAAIRRIGEALLALIFPKRAVCMGCGSGAGCESDWICPDCRRALAAAWNGATRPPKHLDGAACAYVYRGPAVGVVHRLKYDGIRALADFMAGDMARAYAAIAPTGAEAVTSVPMHPRRLRRRGCNHAELLARSVAERLDLPYEPMLLRVRDTPQQARLSRAERLRNVRGAFEAAGPAAGRRVLLVDDVCTTGSTAGACAQALKRAGAARVYLLCYARAAREKGGR